MKELNFDEPVIYTGPNVYIYGVMQFQVYSEGLPDFVSRAIEKIPEIKDLIVPVSMLEKTRAKLAESGSYENITFRKIQKAINEFRRKK
mgnify:FL=1